MALIYPDFVRALFRLSGAALSENVEFSGKGARFLDRQSQGRYRIRLDSAIAQSGLAVTCSLYLANDDPFSVDGASHRWSAGLAQTSDAEATDKSLLYANNGLASDVPAFHWAVFALPNA